MSIQWVLDLKQELRSIENIKDVESMRPKLFELLRKVVELL